MLHRAARNAYSWWWASHIRTKQSKWLDQNMHDMEEKVEYILKIINEEGDSFAVRAEMYYRKRPELVNFVEDCFRNYRALAERYDHLSREFQSANRTIATVFPERVQMAMEEFDEETFSAASSKFFPEAKQPSGDLPAAPPKLTIPRMVSIIRRNSKSPSRMMSRKGLLKMNDVDDLMAIKSSGLTTEEALREIDKLQKDILGLQTEKEFVKSSYENRMSKYWDIEKQVTEMQSRVSSLEDEFGIGTVIEDDEARSLMASTALKSCKETLIKLQAKQEQMADEARVEHWRVKEAREKFEAVIGKVCSNQALLKEQKYPNPSPGTSNQMVPTEHEFPNPSPIPSDQTVSKELESQNPSPGPGNRKVPKEHEFPDPSLGPSNQTVLREHKSPNPSLGLSPDLKHSVGKEKHDMELLRAKIKDELLANGEMSLTVSELVENIDELVDKVINLETEVNSQSVLVKRLRSDSNQLQAHLQSLEEGKDGQIGDSEKKSKKISELEEELCRVQKLNNTIRDQNKNLEARFTEASCNLDILSEKLPNAKHEEEAETMVLFKEGRAVPGVNLEKQIQAHKDKAHPNNALEISKGVNTKQGEDKEYLLQLYPSNPFADRPPIIPEANHPQKGQVRAVLDGIQDQRFKESENKIATNYESLTLRGMGIKEEMMKDRFGGQLNSDPVQGAVRAKPEKGLKKKGDEDKNNEEKEKNELHVHQNQSNQEDELSAKDRDPKKKDLLHTVGSDANEVHTDEEDQPNWRELFLNGLDDRERTLVEEYTSLLGNYKQVKKKLSEVENKNRASLFKSIVQIKVLKSANASKDAEIKSLHRKLNLFISSPDEDMNTHESTSTTSPEETPNTQESASTRSPDETLNTHESKSTTSTDETPNTHESAGNAAVQISHTSTPKSNKKRVRFRIGDSLVEQDVETMEKMEESTTDKCSKTSRTKKEDANKEISAVDEPRIIPTIEEKIRMDIDDLLEENIEFWLRFSTSIHQIKKFQTQFHDLQAESTKVMEKKKRDESTTPRSSDPDIRAIYKHLRDIETELTLWTEHNDVLRDDLQNRLLSLCTIQEEITKLSDSGSQVDQTELSDYQAAKFQGEVMNMKQENNKVASELLAGLDRGKRLKVDIEKTMEKLDEELGISITKNNQMKNSVTRAKIPLKSFLFGVKLKKQKPSLFACISPQLQRQYSDLSAVPPM
ncbi:hypothetical protein LguiB_017465 [Lonicera macranthoides]